MRTPLCRRHKARIGTTWVRLEVPMPRQKGKIFAYCDATTIIISSLAVLGVVLSVSAHSAGAPAEAGADGGIPTAYTEEVQTLTPEECGRCHTEYYYSIKTQGGKHRIDCRRCHVQFHVFRPGKVKYEDILPRCSECHEQVHGPDLTLCSDCHTNAHIPMKIPAERGLEQGCSVCHREADKEMKTYTTMHTWLYCSTCHHTKHRHVPECQECHQPHAEGRVSNAECLACHPPHKALQVVYPEDISQEACAGCHREAYNKLRASGTRHSPLSCAKCHPKHQAILRCRECHPEAHGDRLLQTYPICGRCHGIAHSVLGGS
jgi:hypothetical protein